MFSTDCLSFGFLAAVVLMLHACTVVVVRYSCLCCCCCCCCFNPRCRCSFQYSFTSVLSSAQNVFSWSLLNPVLNFMLRTKQHKGGWVLYGLLPSWDTQYKAGSTARKYIHV